MSSAATPPDLTAYIASLRERIAALRELAQNFPSGIAAKLHQIALSLEADADQLHKLEEQSPERIEC